MLEFYVKQIEDIASQTAQLISNIRTTQAIIKITLDSQRNSLLILELKLVVGTFVLTAGAMTASMFGMNLQSGLETHPSAFYVTTGSILLVSLSIALLLTRRLKKVVRTE